MSKSSNAATLGYALEAFQRARNLTSTELAAWLSSSLEGLAILGSLRRPEPDEPDFNLRCTEIAQQAGCDGFALRILLRWLRASG